MKTSITFFLLFFTTHLFAQHVNVQINKPTSQPEEVSIAINPINTDNIIAGANIRSFYYSTDGGVTWNEGLLSPETYGDPCLIFDANGRAYYAHLSSTWESIKVRHSDDGGKTWSNAVQLRGPSSDSAKAGSYFKSSLQDKEWLVADMTSSAFAGNIYAAWTDFSKYGSPLPKDSSVIAFARSTDHGETFEKYVRVSDDIGDAIDSDNTMEGAVPAVGPNGEVYIAWSGPKGIYFDKSFDGGKTFGKDLVLTNTPSGWDFPIEGIFRCNGLPITCCDISHSPHRGTVYVNWVDFRNGDADVFILKSTDKGTTWSNVKRVNDDAVGNGRQQFFTWMSVDPVNGNISIVFYDRRRYTGDSTDVYLARSTDGGETFVNTRISDAAFYPTTTVFFGDYNCIASYNGRIRPIWTELTNGVLSIHTALIEPGIVHVNSVTTPEKIYLGQNYPNPFFSRRGHAQNSRTSIKFSLNESGYTQLKIYDMLGREVTTLVDDWFEAGEHTVSVAGTSLTPGNYFYQLQTGNSSLVKMMTCVE